MSPPLRVPNKGPWFSFLHHHSFTYNGVTRPSFTARGLSIPYFISRMAWAILDCARRTSTFLSCAFREQEDGQATLPFLRRPRVARAQKIIRLHPSSILRARRAPGRSLPILLRPRVARGPSNPLYLSLGEWPGYPLLRASNDMYAPSKLACSLSRDGG